MPMTFVLLSLVTNVYKIVTKILSKRLWAILGITIYEARNTFTRERRSTDAAFISNEVMEDFERKGQRI